MEENKINREIKKRGWRAGGWDVQAGWRADGGGGDVEGRPSGWRHGRPFFLAKRRIGEALIGVNPTLITVLIQSAMYIVRLEDPTARKLMGTLSWVDVGKKQLALYILV